MSIEYVLIGGQLILDKEVFTRELLNSKSHFKDLINPKGLSKPDIIKNESCVIIDYNYSSNIPLDENYYEIFKTLKSKYKEKIKGKVTVRISLYNTLFTAIDLNSEDDIIR